MTCCVWAARVYVGFFALRLTMETLGFTCAAKAPGMPS